MPREGKEVKENILYRKDKLDELAFYTCNDIMEVVYKKEQVPVDIDLSIENLTKETILNIFKENM